jgi:hypothetical protein
MAEAMTPEQQEELQGAIMDAFDLDGLTQLVFFEMGEVLSNLVGTGGAFQTVVFNLITKLKQRGTAEVLAHAVCKARPSNSKVRAYAAKYLAGDGPKSPATMATNVGVALGNVAAAAAQGAGGGQVDGIKEVVREFGDDFTNARELTDKLGTFKALHDQLHVIDTRLFAMIRRALGTFRGNADERLALGDYTGELSDCAAAAAKIAQTLPPLLRQTESGWIQRIEQVVTLIRSSLAGADSKTDENAVTLLRRPIQSEPPRINAQMVMLAAQLQEPLGKLTEALAKLATADPARGEQVRVARADLEALRPRLAGLLLEHTAWQQIDIDLRLIPETAAQPLDPILIVWDDVSRAARELCDPKREEAWAATLTATARRFDETGRAGKADEQRQALQEFARLARKRFFDVDKELDEVCNSLVRIGEPLTLLLGLIGR